MRGRVVVACAVTVLGLTGGVTARAAAPLVLAGSTTITVPSGAGQLLVRVPKTVNLPGRCDAAGEVTVRGTASFVAVVLAPTPYRPGVPAVVMGRLPDGRSFDTVCAIGERPLPADTYTLTVVHTPGTAAVTLTLPGLPSRLAITRMRTVRASAAVLPKVDAAPADVSASAGGWGTDGALTGKGMVATIMWLSGSIDAALFGSCSYPPDVRATLPHETRYAPGCPTGESGMSWAVRSSAVFFTTETLGIDPGTYGLGAWYTAPVGSVVSGGAVGLWVPYA
jgi:hypothetical protein